MSDVDTATVLAGLKGFQRDAVDHVIDRFYGDGARDGSGRFLVADETGLGKSIIARGVIARAIEHLEHDPSVDRIDIVYICSNVDLARQNLRRLNVTGQPDLALATRLTLLARDLPQLVASPDTVGKKINLISFTPSTSGMAGGGWRTGRWEERALLAILLRDDVTDGLEQWTTLLELFQWTMGGESFRRGAEWMARDLSDGIDPSIVASFEAELERNSPTDGDLRGELRDLVRRRVAGAAVDHGRVGQLLGRLRQLLARSSINALEPDLVILDEFQKFRDLLAPPETSEAAELADAMFSYEGARVLLLSATPYSPFTQAQEGDEDHHRDFLKTVGFLTRHDSERLETIKESLDRYRATLTTGGEARPAAEAVRTALLPYLSRSERPQVEGAFVVRDLQVESPTVDDVVEFATLRSFGEEVEAPVDIEYWKSIPYFANFMDGYKPGERARAAFGTSQGVRAESLLAQTRALDVAEIESFTHVDPANGYLRGLAEETLGQGWWRLLWVPPSMPYLEPGPVYAAVPGMTKRLVFSAWSGVPTSVASLLSYGADRHIANHSRGFWSANTPRQRERVAERFTYRTREGEVGALSTLALFWPHPELADRGDPWEVARTIGGVAPADVAERRVADNLPAPQDDVSVGDAFFSIRGGFPDGVDVPRAVARAMSRTGDDQDEADRDRGVLRHVGAAQERARQFTAETGHRDLPRFALHAPGTIAYRAVRRIAGPDVTAGGLWAAAFIIADGLRRLFDRMESVATLVGIYGDDHDTPYWSSVLAYCADGNLQAVLDEYLFQLRSELGGQPIDDASLESVARTVSQVLRLRPARYQAHDTSRERTPIPFTARFALRYGARFGEAAERDSLVRAAFNSPFAPFVLISTSVGQEGIDFHWWCHAVVHWNLPSSPVDFEQREGRVNRYAGHAIRRNVAAAHWTDVLASLPTPSESEGATTIAQSPRPNPWDQAFQAARTVHSVEYGEFAPWWVYPGPAQIQRVLARYPLSRDHEKYERLRDALSLYRLTLGQPRQEDMVELMRKRGIDPANTPTIDLRPPSSPAHGGEIPR